MTIIEQHSIHNDKEIRGFFGTYRFLSNFHRSPVFIDGCFYPSSEHAYMAQKTHNKYIKDIFSDENMSSKEARAEGQKIELREDWEEVKVQMMYNCLLSKFLNGEKERKMLLATGDKYLEELNYWKDFFWGADLNGKGQNNLGKLLMRVRQELSIK